MTEDRNIIEEQQNIERKQDDIPKGSERIFEGGPTRDMIENWKRQYGDIYMTKFDSETFIWRTLTRLEFKNLLNTEGDQTEWYREERLAELCVLWPLDYNHEKIIDGKAGTPAILADQIMNKSGFMPTIGAQKL